MTTPINPGNSGGPILSAEGKVIGIAVAVIRRFGQEPIEGVTFGIKLATVIPLLQRSSVKFSNADEGQTLPPSQIFAKFAKDVVMIEAKQ